MELDTGIEVKIDNEQDFEEETIEADTYQMTLEEHIAVLFARQSCHHHLWILILHYP